MKAKVPKSYKQLSHTDQQDLKKFTQDAYGFGEKRLRIFLAGHKRVFARQFRLVERGEQLQYLNKRMDEIFKKDGFPQNFIDDLLGEVDVEVK
jgi:type II secretory pathway predicted ATPase ExeA